MCAHIYVLAPVELYMHIAATPRSYRHMEELRRSTSSSLEEEPMASYSSSTTISRGATSCKGTDHGGDDKRSKCELVGYDALPEWLKDNEFILGYYRCEWPIRETILSAFSVHNETLNVWSHLIGFLLFMSLTIFTAMVIPRDGSMISSSSNSNNNLCNASSSSVRSYWGDLMVMANMTGVLRHEGAAAACLLLPPAADLAQDEDEEEIPNSCPPPNTSSSSSSSSSLPHHHAMIQDAGAAPLAANVPVDLVTRWPVFAYLGGAMVCLLTSSACHLVMCHSERTAYVTLRLDYAGIAALIVTSFYPVVYYSFLCDPGLRRLYMASITAFGAAAVTASLVPAFQAPELRPLRAALFSCMGVSGLVPVAHKLALYGAGRREAVVTAYYEALMGTFYGLGVAVYAARVPERWLPGRFDLVGHSHQLFHLFVVAGAYAHYLGGLEYLKWRDADKCW